MVLGRIELPTHGFSALPIALVYNKLYVLKICNAIDLQKIVLVFMVLFDLLTIFDMLLQSLYRLF